MDNVDVDLEKAERAASPGRFPDTYSPNGTPANPGYPDGNAPQNLERQRTASTGSSASGVIREEMGMSRVNTQRDLERHPTEIHRIETHRSQHVGTVGRSVTSRRSQRPLPNFGAGKEYPPMLPEEEDYVVEFDGPDDAMHPQNWPMKKKCVHLH